MNVKSVVSRHLAATPPPTLGSRGARTSTKARALANDLMAVSRTNTIYFAGCFGAILLLLIGAGTIAVRYIDSPATIQRLFTVLGISITALTAQLASLWKQKVSADLLLVLARNVDEEQLKPILDTLLAKL
jgi:hypothetical protein